MDFAFLNKAGRIKHPLVAVLLISIMLAGNGCREPDVIKSPPADRILGNSELLLYLTSRWADDKGLTELVQNADTQAVLIALAKGIKVDCATNYYFDWRTFDERFDQYSTNYDKAMERHAKLADLHQSLYQPETSWQLPFTNELGKSVTAYELRHLARQQKSLDMTIMYFFDEAHKHNLDYFVRQVADLNRAFAEGSYDDEGNGVYETYRAGKRIHNWLFNHHAYLATDEYTSEHQLLLIRTFLHHGAQLAKRSGKYRPGNHHTKGLVALYEIAASFPMFSVAGQWRKQAVDGLLEHMDKEINDDGFQFERSVHYHIGDLENYIRVYQLARAGGYNLPEEYTQSLKALFDALVKIAKPDKSLPVEQDDTDSPHETSNDAGHIFAIAAALFGDPVYGHFADAKFPAEFYWLLTDKQLINFGSKVNLPPAIGSIALPQTGYYVMRNGWDYDDQYMIISAGLSDTKPDHQHGDMLGVYAYSGGHVILPNYQVKYNTPELPVWKNSWVKNVAIVDSIPQGNEWKGNRGGSGFGKWLDLPTPKVETFITRPTFDYFKGSHGGYESLGVHYNREVLFLKEPGFWVVRDNFEAEELHRYQQIWQGDFRTTDRNVLSCQLDGGEALYIIQLGDSVFTLAQSNDEVKPSSIVGHSSIGNYSFSTYIGVTESRPDIKQIDGGIQLTGIGNWSISSSSIDHFTLGQLELMGQDLVAISDGINYWVLGVTKIESDSLTIEYPLPMGVHIISGDSKNLPVVEELYRKKYIK